MQSTFGLSRRHAVEYHVHQSSMPFVKVVLLRRLVSALVDCYLCCLRYCLDVCRVVYWTGSLCPTTQSAGIP